MKMINLFIVSQDIDYAMELSHQLSKDPRFKVLGTENDGKKALSTILSLAPNIDVVITDLVLSNLSGYEIIRAIKENEKLKSIKGVIVTSVIGNRHTQEMARLVGADDFFTLPLSISPLSDSIANLYETTTEPLFIMDDILAEIFHQLGIPAHLRGYQYLMVGVKLVFSDATYLEAITKSLYPDIAKEFETTMNRVERSMRHALNVGWNRGNTDYIDELFGYMVSAEKGKPTNSEFIATVVEKVRSENRKNYRMITK